MGEREEPDPNRSQIGARPEPVKTPSPKRVDEAYPPHIIESAREWRWKNGRSY